MKYSDKFESDYNWYLSVSGMFSFDGNNNYLNKKGVDIIQTCENGKLAKECFYMYDTRGIITPTSEPEKLQTLLKTKGSVNLHIKMYAEDRARGYLPKVEFQEICTEFNCPKWFIDAVENQKKKYYERRYRSKNKDSGW